MPPALARRSSSKTARGSAEKYCPRPSRSASSLQHLQVVQHAGGWRQRPPAPDHPALEVGHRALLLGPLGGGQHDVGELGGLGEEDVGDDQQVQRGEPVAHPVDVGRGDDDVGGQHQQRPHAAGGAQPVEHLERRQPRAGQLGGVDPPDRGDVRAVGRVGQLAVAGQLVGLLAVLTPALPVALPGDRAVARVRAPGQPEGQGEVDEGLRGVGAAAVLLGAARGQNHRAVGRRERLDGRRSSATGTPVIRSTRSGQ